MNGGDVFVIILLGTIAVTTTGIFLMMVVRAVSRAWHHGKIDAEKGRT
jgi:hypothetical protein